jgi:hypothetical protein
VWLVLKGLKAIKVTKGHRDLKALREIRVMSALKDFLV